MAKKSNGATTRIRAITRCIIDEVVVETGEEADIRSELVDDLVAVAAVEVVAGSTAPAAPTPPPPPPAS